MRRNCLSRLTQRSTRLRRLYASRSYSIGVLRLEQRRDNGLDASVHQIVVNFVAIVALVAEEFVRIYIVKFHQRIIAFDLVHLAAGDIESQRVAFGVRAEVDFGREAAARAAERFLILIPPYGWPAPLMPRCYR